MKWGIGLIVISLFNIFFLYLNFLGVMDQLKIAWIFLVQVFKHAAELNVILPDELSVDECSVFIEDVIVGLKVEDVTSLQLVFNFYLVFNHKGHVAEAKAQVFIQDQPVMVIAVELRSFSQGQDCLPIYLLNLIQVLDLERLNLASLLSEDDTILRYDVGVALLVPDNIIVFG